MQFLYSNTYNLRDAGIIVFILYTYVVDGMEVLSVSQAVAQDLAGLNDLSVDSVLQVCRCFLQRTLLGSSVIALGNNKLKPALTAPHALVVRATLTLTSDIMHR